MFDILTYPFFQKALLGIILISIASAIVGTNIVSRRLVSISGGITHACFGGLGLGYFLGLNPVAMAVVVAIGSSLSVEWMISRRGGMRQDSAVAVIWALGMALGILFVFLTPGYVPELNTFLFGNVLTISSADTYCFAGFTLILVAFNVIYHRSIVACAFDPDFARLKHIPTKAIAVATTVATAVCIVLTIRLVGIMLLMSMLVMPQIIAELFCHRYKSIMLASIVISLAGSVGGLFLATIINVPCSALIVMVMISLYILARIAKAMRLSPIASAVLLLLMVSASSCSLKKNTAATRNYTAFITRYNIYFNGDEHYKETLQKVESEYEDDFSRHVLMHPAESYADEELTHPQGDFKRSIEKAQKAIQLRSIKKRPARKAGKGNDPKYKEWLKRDEYNPFLHNAWMMMGRSQYMNGDFLGAAATFYYVQRHFKWLPATVTEAKLWQARSYCAIDWLFEAESIVNSVKEKDIADNRTLEALYYFTAADVFVRSSDYDRAIPLLEKAISYASGAQKNRLSFLLGQIYEEKGNRDEAYKWFKRVGSSSSASYRTRFNARIKQSEVFAGKDISSEVSALKRMARYGTNKQYLDQIYYAIANLYLSRGDTTQAITNYEKAIKESTRNGIDKALAQLTLGQLYYQQHAYDKAQPLMSEALPVIPKTYPGYAELRSKSDVLDELAVYAQNVTLQDSLLRLSYLPDDEQRKIVGKIIDDLNKKEREQAEAERRQAYLENQAAAGNGLQQTSSAAPTTFQMNTDRSWYFYNEATRNAGRTEFQKRWGRRRLEDDWRRRVKTSFATPTDESTPTPESEQSDSLSADGEQPTQQLEGDALIHATDPHYPEYYLSQIPHNDLERANANDIIQEGLYNMGVILKDKLFDDAAAQHEFNQLLTRYPDNIYRLDTYFNLYLMYARAGKLDKAEQYRQLILTDFPNSRQGEALSSGDYLEKLLKAPQVENQLYDQAYEAYMTNDNATLHSIYQLMRKDYPMSRIMPKFMFLEALAYVTENNPEKFAETLRELITRFPDTDVSPLASSYLELLEKGRKFNTSATNVRGIVWSTRLSNDSTATATLDTPAQFDFQSDGPQVVLLIYRTDRVNANQLLFDVARHNFFTYTVSDFDIQQLQFSTLGLLVISGFNNQAEATQYRSKLETGLSGRLPAGVVPLIISKHNFDLLLNEGRTLDEYFEAAGDTRINQIHTQVLPPDQYPSQKEMQQIQQQQAQPQQPQQPQQQAQPQQPDPIESTPLPSNPESPSTPSSPSTPTPEPEYEYDIPIPVLPTVKPPIAPKL